MSKTLPQQPKIPTDKEILSVGLNLPEEADWPVEETMDLEFKTAREVLKMLAQARAAGNLEALEATKDERQAVVDASFDAGFREGVEKAANSLNEQAVFWEDVNGTIARELFQRAREIRSLRDE